MNETPKEYSGDQIEGLFSSPSTVEIKLKTEKWGTIRWQIKPMSNTTYAKMGAAMEDSGVDPEKANNLEALKIFSNVYYPAMKIVFPACCVVPKVTLEESKTKGEIHIENIPMEVCMKLFNEIMNESGFSEEKIQERKNS